MARARVVPYLLIAPALVVVVALTFLPALYAIDMSLNDMVAGTGRFRFVGLANYRQLVHASDFWNSFGISVRFAFFYVLITLALGLALALLANRRPRLVGLYLTLIFIPWVLSDLVAGIVWQWLFNQQVGVLELALHRLGLTPQQGIIGTAGGATAVMVCLAIWRSLPFTALLLLAGLQTISREVIESARVDGATSWAVFRRVIAPLMRPQVLVVLLLLTIGALNTIGIFIAVTGGGPGQATEVLALYMYEQGWNYFRLGYASAVSVFLLVVNVAVATVYIRSLRTDYRL